MDMHPTRGKDVADSSPSRPTPTIAVWGGVECTVNRVKDTYYDQMERSGHATRVSDLDRFAALGITALRYPVLWERVAPNGPQAADWSWPDERLYRIRELGIRPIVGLVHHGSGPRHTSLVDPSFAEELTRYARAVAERYPWVEDYTPVNEPLTTARFSGLYGLWYPHCRDDRVFARALLNQCRAVVRSMAAIRQVNPQARLVQTDDMGEVFSTPALAGQATFENERRWLSFDLLCGRVDESHPLWGYLRRVGVTVAELEWFREHTCPPDIVGINTYLTSQRFLDDRIDRYPTYAAASNGTSNYADVASVHIRAAGLVSHEALLMEAWERYHLPVAITEAHNGSTREEQVRWLAEVWQGAQAAQRQGADVRAVTAWALLGGYDWQTLLTRQDNVYEPGIFDVRGSEPRPTALAHLLRDMAAGKELAHPVLDAPGWWHRPQRFCFGDDLDVPLDETGAGVFCSPDRWSAAPRLIIITGANGTLGRAFERICAVRGLPCVSLTRQELDIADAGSVAARLDDLHPWAVINAAGFVRVDDAEHEVERCYRENVEGPALLAAACHARDIKLLTFSSDLVFDGTQDSPYLEHDPVAPLNVYGHSKAEAERQVLAASPDALVVRTSAFFGPWDEHNVVIEVLRALASGEHVVVTDDTIVSPTYVPDLVHAALDLLIDDERGIWHLANAGEVSWAALAHIVAKRAGYATDAVLGVPMKKLRLAAPRPQHSVLGSSRGNLMPSLESALDRYFHECEVQWQEDATLEATA